MAAAGNKDRILAEAAQLFVAQGYHGISMREIAVAAGLSKAGLYYHFADKEQLFLAILQANLETLGAQVAHAADPQRSTREQVAAIFHAVFALTPEQRSVIRLASQEMAQLSPEARQTFNALYHQQFIGRIAAVLQQGIDRGELRQMDVPLATWILLGMAYPFFYPAHAQELGPPDDAIDLMLTLFFSGAARS